MGDLARGRAAREARKDKRPARRGETKHLPGPAQRAARRVNSEACPDGYDANVWALAVYFEQLAEQEGWRLATGRPVIYAIFEKKLGKLGWQKQCLDARGKPLAHPKWPGWVALMRACMIEFFENRIEHTRALYAAEQFVSLLDDLSFEFLEGLEIERLRREPRKDNAEYRQQLRVEGDKRRARRAAQAPPERPAPFRRDRERRGWEDTRARAQELIAARKTNKGEDA